MAKSTLRLTNNAAAVKASAAGTYTFALATDLKLSNETVNTPVVNIQAVRWCGAAASTINITRNSVSVMDINSATAGFVDFTGAEMNDSTGNSSDIVITIVGNAQIWLTLRKESGYASGFEPAQFSVYDNPTLVGS